MPWDWIFESSTKTFHCFTAKTSRQLKASLHKPTTLSPFHDAELMRATEEINTILDRVRNNKGAGRELSFIVFRDELLLVWAKYGAVSADDEEATVADALGLSP
jgi:hypothetical protein